MEQIDCAVIGAGVVGLAVARAMALAGCEVVIIEREGGIGSITSARNSEVIHAGLYYPSGSLKARLCVRGRALLLDYLRERRLPHQLCGKLIVATGDEQLPKLQALQAQGLANGVEGLRLLSGDEAMAMEPALHCVAALHSPGTGILDSHALMLSLLGDAQAAGATLALTSKVLSGRPLPGGGLALEVQAGVGDGVGDHMGGDPDQRMPLLARQVINAAGLSAPALASRIEGLPISLLPRARFAKGSYLSLTGRSPFSRLIYPLPEPGGLGVHLTLDLAGAARFGPDVQWLDINDEADIDYRVDASRLGHFTHEIRRYWPGLREGSLQPAYAGVRPKIAMTGGQDFVIQGPGQHGLPGLVNLFGIESPGLTSSLAIAEEVVGLLTR